MTLLTKEQILAADDLKSEEVNVPEWAGTVRLRMLTAGERDLFEAQAYQASKSNSVRALENFRVKWVAKGLVDETGNPLFTSKELDQLAGKSSKVIVRLHEQLQKLNGIDPIEAKELEGN